MAINFCNGFYARRVILISCDIQSNSNNCMDEIIIDSCTALKIPNKNLDVFELVLNIASDSPAIISFTENGYNFSVENQNYLISRSIKERAYLYSRTKHVTFYNDQLNPDFLREVGLAYSGTDDSTITITKSGNWPHSLQKQLQVIAKYPYDKIIIDKNDRRFIKIYSDDYSHSNYPNYFYVIAHGEELEKCRKIRDEIATDKETNCPKYEDTYMIYCKGNITIICEEDDQQFANIPKITIDQFSISIESNQAVIDLSLLPKIDTIQIAPINFSESTGPTTTIKGSNVNCDYLAFMNLKIYKIDCDMTINYLGLYLSEIMESQYHLFSESIDCDQYSIDNYSPDFQPIANVCKGEKSFYFNVIITFTKDKLNVIFNDYDGNKQEQNFPYNLVNMFYIRTGDNSVTFNVNDASTALLKPIQLKFSDSSNIITFIQTGEWKEPLKGPLNISLIDNSYYLYYDTSSLDLKWFNFDIQDMHEAPPQENHYYNYFIGNGEELSFCISARDDILHKNECSYYEYVFGLQCEYDVHLFCEENDYSFRNIPSHVNIIIIVGTNAPKIDLSKMSHKQNILLMPYIPMDHHRNLKMKSVSRPNKSENNKLNIKEDLDPICDVSLKGIKVYADSLYIEALNVKLTENNLTTNRLMMFGSKVVSTDFYIQSEFLYADEYSLSINNHIFSNAFDVIDFDNDGTKFYNFTVNFTQNSWHVYAEFEYIDNIERYEYIIPYWVANRVYSFVYGENMTFNVDDPNTAKLKSVEIITSQPNFTFYSIINH